MKKLLMAAFLLLCLALPALAEEVPYRQKVVRPDEMIFSGPSYDEFCVGTVLVKGVFTIVEEAEDGEGHLWGGGLIAIEWSKGDCQLCVKRHFHCLFNRSGCTCLITILHSDCTIGAWHNLYLVCRSGVGGPSVVIKNIIC